MATAAAVATQLTDHSAKPYSLLVGGNDVLRVANTADAQGGYRIATPWDSITVEQTGPGRVSSLSFTVETPMPAYLISDSTFTIGTDVLLQDNTNNLPIFRGFISRFSEQPAFGDVAVSWEVHCDGAEILLDWAFLPVEMTFPVGTNLGTAVQAVIANSVGVGPLRAFKKTSGFSDQAAPMGFTNSLIFGVTTFGPGSLRSVIGAMVDSVVAAGSATISFTVDYWYGLRMWEVPVLTSLPTDWGTLNLSAAGKPEGLVHEFDGSGLVRGVYVLGSNPAFTALVFDGTGQLGQIAYVSDPTLTSAAQCQTAALAYLQDFASTIRGSLNMYDRAPTANIWPGCPLMLANTALDINYVDPSGADAKLRISTIVRTFTGLRENWSVTYGPGDPGSGVTVAPTNPRGKPSMTELIRHLTRDTLS